MCCFLCFVLMIRRPPRFTRTDTLFPYTALFRSQMDHISVQATGSGAPVILIPGLASPRAVYDGIVPAIEGTHRVYTVQVNGFGGGDPGKNLAPGILDGIVADLDAFMAANKLSGAAVVVHSINRESTRLNSSH